MLNSTREECACHNDVVSKIVALVFISMLVASPAYARKPTAEYPAEANAFLAQELPQMEVAVAAKDRDYFKGASERTRSFLNSWGMNMRAEEALSAYPACTAAVSDFLIAGLCRISEPGTLCEPDTFLPKVDANIATCKALAATSAK